MTDQEIDAIREQYATCDPTYGRWHTDERKLRSFARAMVAKQEQEITALHAKLAGETLRADQGWQRYEAANKARINADALLSKAIPEGYVVVPKEPTADMNFAAMLIIPKAYEKNQFPIKVWGAMIAAAPSVEGEGS